MKLLSICIPTYNRKDCLVYCLESIVHQSIFSDIEIIVSDNASSDGTDGVIGKYTKKYSNIIYSRNNKNIGFDRNILKTVSLASGKYCLFIGDDDAFFDDSLQNIINLLIEERAEYYITNNWGYNNTLLHPAVLHPNLNIKEDQFYSSLRDFVYLLQPNRVKTVGFFGGMSGQIFLKKRWDDFGEKEKFIGTQTIHLFILLSAMKEGTFGLIALPTIKTRADNIRWDTFDLNSAFRREKVTLDTFCFIAGLYQIPYSKGALYGRFFVNYMKNLSIFYIKKYILKDQKTILKIKTYISKRFPHN